MIAEHTSPSCITRHILHLEYYLLYWEAFQYMLRTEHFSLWLMMLSYQLELVCSQGVFCCSRVDSSILHQNTLISEPPDSSPSWMLWWLHIPVVIIFLYNWLNRLTPVDVWWKLHLRTRQTYGGPQFCVLMSCMVFYMVPHTEASLWRLALVIGQLGVEVHLF